MTRQPTRYVVTCTNFVSQPMPYVSAQYLARRIDAIGGCGETHSIEVYNPLLHDEYERQREMDYLRAEEAEHQVSAVEAAGDRQPDAGTYPP